MKGCGGALSSGQNNGKNYRDSGRRKKGGTRQIWGSSKPIQSPPVSVDRALHFLPQKKQKLRGLLLLLLLAGYIHKSEETKLTTIDLKIQVVYVVTDLESFNSVLQWLNEIDCHELWQNNYWSNTLGISDVTEAYQAAIIRPSVLITKNVARHVTLGVVEKKSSARENPINEPKVEIWSIIFCNQYTQPTSLGTNTTVPNKLLPKERGENLDNLSQSSTMELEVTSFFVGKSQMIQSKDEEIDCFRLAIDPKDAAIDFLEQILMGGDEYNKYLNASSVISADGIPALAKLLERMEGRRSFVSILLCCMQAEKSCKSLIAIRIELSPVLELFQAGSWK